MKIPSTHLQPIKACRFSRLPAWVLLFLLSVIARPACAQLPYAQSFTTTSAPRLIFGGSPSALLTAGQTVSYGNGTTTDPTTAGYLRLTSDVSSAGGYVYSNSAFPAQYGLRLSFEYFIYGSSFDPADGLSFFLFDGATTAFNIGSYGGGLGYRAFDNTQGISNGYLGIGFDVYGNYSTGGPGGFKPNSIVVRGPGNGTTGYGYITGVQTPYTVGSGGTARVPDSTQSGYRRAIISLIPKAVSGGYSYNISITVVTGGATPTYNTIFNNYTGFSAVAPTFLKYGFAASTGGLQEAHEIRNLTVAAYNQPTGQPTAVNDTAASGCGTNAFNIPVLNNDIPVNAPLSFDSTSVRLINPANNLDTGNSYTIAGVGTFSSSNSFGSKGFVVFTSASSFTGATSIKYVVRDVYGKQSNAATITVNATSPTGVALSATVTKPTCNGSSNGAVVINGSSSLQGYTYALGNGAYTSSGSFTGLAAGTYLFHTKNNSGCIRDTTITIGQPTALTLSSTQTSIACKGGSNGSITATGGGGTAPYTYALNAGAYSGNNTFSNLVAGPYTLHIKDAANCTADIFVYVEEPEQALDAYLYSMSPVCAGLDGSVDIYPYGGGQPGVYTASINGGTFFAVPATPTLAVGNYTITLKDSFGCTISDSFEVLPYNSSFSVEIQNPTCPGEPGTAYLYLGNGELSLFIGYGSSYQAPDSTKIQVDNQTIHTTSSYVQIDSLTPGNKTFLITRYFSTFTCLDTAYGTIATPVATVFTTTPKAPSCNGNTNGQITVSVTDGTPPYAYSLDGLDYDTASVFTGLAAGTYTVYVLNAYECVQQATVTVTQPPVLVANTTKTNVSCGGGYNGSIVVTGTGGTAPYTYGLNENPLTASNTFTGLGASNYVVHIRDANGCDAFVTVVITQPAALTLGTTKTNVACNGSSTGSITATGGGGTGPYTFALGTGTYSSNNIFTNLAAGSYTVNIKDANNCTQQVNVTLTQPAALTLGTTKTNVACNGGSTGSITATGSGGTGPYTFALGTGTYSINSTFTNLAAGTYTVFVKDAANCTQQTTVAITQPTAIGLATTQNNPSCSDFANGSITATGSGGTSPYTFALGTGTYSSNNIFTNLAAGSYVVRIKDAANCTNQVTVTLTQPALLVITGTPTNVSCNGGGTGSIVVTGTGGTLPYMYGFGENALTSNNTFTGLGAGNYPVRIRDASGCDAFITVVVTEPAALTLGTTKTNVACNGNATGSITATGGGGTGPYTFALGTGTYSTNSTFTNLAAGSYVVRIKDAANCTNQANVTITQPAALVLGNTQTNVLCNGNATGSITASGTGGTTPYTYALNAGAYSGTNTFTNLAAGTYTLRIKDAANCTNQSTVVITQPTAVGIATTSVNPLCNSGATGSITVTGSGGATPYQYAISSNSFSSTSNNIFANLSAGTYQVRVIDANGCMAQASVTLTDPPVLAISSTQTNVGCNGGNNGSITGAGAGGTAPYTFALNTGTYTTTNTFSNLTAGTYTVRIKDANNCLQQTTVTITQPAVLNVSATQTNVGCNGGTNGNITATGAGGVTPYTFALGTGTYTTTNTFSNLAAGTYTVRIKDANNCLQQATVTITQPAVLNVSATQTNILCNGGNNGSVVANGAGGTAPYTFALGTGAYTSASSFSSLSAGTYVVNIKDAANCTAQTTVTLTQPAVLNVVTTQTNVDCNSNTTGSVSATGSGGVAPYTFALNTGAYSGSSTFSNLAAGTYTVRIKDANSCLQQATVTITQPAVLNVSATQTNVLCNGGATGSITATGTGGTLPYTYALGTGSYISSNTFAGLIAGTYTVRIKDANNCLQQTTVTVAEPTILALTATQTNVLCNGGATGSITATGTGGTAPYTFALGTGTFSANNAFTGLTAGTYTVRIQDANSCTAQTTIAVGEPAPLLLAGTTTAVTCFGTATGSATVTGTGGIGPYTFAIGTSAFSGTSNFSGLAAGSYSFNVKDANGCIASTTLTITQPALLTLAAQVVPVTCNGTATGSINATAAGGTAPYLYALNTGGFLATNNFSNLAAGTYTLRVQDANGCTAQTTVTITQPAVLTATLAVTQPVCFGEPSGSITVVPAGGNGSYSYRWNTGATTATISNLLAGTYLVTTTDSKGCTRTDSTTLVNPTQYFINLGPDRTLCRAQTVTLNATINVENTRYQWTADNGFTSNEPVVTLNKSGVYQVLATTPLGCKVSDTIKIEISTDSIISDFVAASQGFKDSLYTLVNISSPAPDSVQWVFPPADKCTVRSKLKGSAEVVFTQMGVYEVSLKTFLGACFEVTTKKVIVVEGPVGPAPPAALAPFIKEFSIAPNPSSGVFEVKLELAQATDANLLVIDANTGIVADRKLLVNVEKQTVPYSLNIPQGTYILLLKTAQASRSLKLLIQ